ncbi:MAG: hypothetical protein O8C55_14190 [Candidatus Methanoperedens sp.]|nr:hypothetical protein [Candidatus Methanoperedens sp.]
MSCISPCNLPVNIHSFRPSCITVVEGSSNMIPAVLFSLCAASAAAGRDAVFLDGWNSFDPYAVSGMAKSFGAGKQALSRIHVARAFTEYQMDALINNLDKALERWAPEVLAVSYFPTLFSGVDGMRLFEPLLMRLKSLTSTFGTITAITSFGGSWHGDRLLASRASRVVRIEEKKKLVRIFDDGHMFEYVPVPPGQMRFTDFAGGDAYGQDGTFLSQPA